MSVIEMFDMIVANDALITLFIYLLIRYRTLIDTFGIIMTTTAVDLR